MAVSYTHLVWQAGNRVTRFIGYDAGERKRYEHSRKFNEADKKYENRYPLIEDWHWTRDDCIRAIQEAGLPLPGKSSCFFCPSIDVYKRQVLDGKARLAQLHAIFHMDEQASFQFEWDWLAPSGLSTKDFIGGELLWSIWNYLRTGDSTSIRLR